MELFFAFALALVVAFYILKPLIAFSEGGLNQDNTLGTNESDSAQRTENMLSDLELDYATGKLSLADYEELKNS